MTQTTQAQIDSGESNLDQVPPGSILPGLFEACIMMGYRLLSILAFLAGAVILGCLVAWVLAGGPHMPAAYAGIARTQGIVLGMVGYVAGWAWGRWRRAEQECAKKRSECGRWEHRAMQHYD